MQVEQGGVVPGAHGRTGLIRWDTSTAAAVIVAIALVVLGLLHFSFRAHGAVSV